MSNGTGLILGIIQIFSGISFLFFILGYWGGIVSGDLMIVGVLLTACIDGLISSIILDLFMPIIEAFGQLLDALFGLFKR